MNTIIRQEHHLKRLERLFQNESLEAPFYLRGIQNTLMTPEAIQAYDHPEILLDKALSFLEQKTTELQAKDEVFRPLSIESNMYQTHFLDRVFGAEVWYAEDENQWYNRYLSHPVGDLAVPDLERNATWNQVKALAEEYLRRQITTYYFATPTLSSPLNIAVNLYGEKMLLAFHTAPAAAQRDLCVITEIICALHQWYLDHIPLPLLQPVVPTGRFQPPGHGQICGCTTHLISAGMYRDFVAPLDEQILFLYPNGGMIHLCGSHSQHIPVWREMQALKAVQMNDRAAEDFEQYYHELREDQILYLNPTPEMTSKKVLEISRGKRVVLCCLPS